VTDLVTAALDINKPLIFGSRWYSVLSVCLLPGYRCWNLVYPVSRLQSWR